MWKGKVRGSASCADRSVERMYPSVKLVGRWEN